MLAVPNLSVTDLDEISSTPLINENATATHGQPSIAAKFPDLVNIAADFVKQAWLCCSAGTSSGVSVAQICEHLLDKVPGLREQHGISLSTTRRLFHVPNKGNIASHRYKAMVDGK
jgi:hypothetical protein